MRIFEPGWLKQELKGVLTEEEINRGFGMKWGDADFLRAVQAKCFDPKVAKRAYAALEKMTVKRKERKR